MGDIQPHEWDKDIFDKVDRKYDDMPTPPVVRWYKVWRELCGLPQEPGIYNLNIRRQTIVILLDTLEEIHPVPSDIGELNKYNRLSIWIESSPLLSNEVRSARWFIANEIC